MAERRIRITAGSDYALFQRDIEVVTDIKLIQSFGQLYNHLIKQYNDLKTAVTSFKKLNSERQRESVLCSLEMNNTGGRIFFIVERYDLLKMIKDIALSDRRFPCYEVK